MIIVNSNNDKERLLFISKSIKSLLEDERNHVIFIDENDDFKNIEDINPIIVHFSIKVDDVNIFDEENIQNKDKLYIINSDCPIEYCLKRLKALESALQSLLFTTFIFYNTNDLSRAEFVLKEYEKTNVV